MFDYRKDVFTRAALCELSGFDVETVKSLRKTGDWIFVEDDVADRAWRRYSAEDVLMAAAVRHLADPRGYGLSWRLAKRIVTNSIIAPASAALRSHFGIFTEADALRVLDERWPDRAVDLWAGYARIGNAAGSDLEGWSLPGGTLPKILVDVASTNARRVERGETVTQLVLFNVSHTLRAVMHRAAAAAIEFPASAPSSEATE